MAGWRPAIADLTRYLGGGHVLRTLADPNKTGQVDTAIAQSYLDAGCGRVSQRALVKYDAETLDALDTESAQTLFDMALAQAARTAYTRGGQGQVMPDNIAEDARRADKDLDDLKNGDIKLSRVSGGVEASITQPAKIVDYDPDGKGISRLGFVGFR